VAQGMLFFPSHAITSTAKEPRQKTARHGNFKDIEDSRAFGR
jgi:hypothetical protein